MAISSALGSSALIPSGFGFRNLLINGDFRVAQRGTSFVSGANNDDTYNLDRWTVLSDGNDVVDITQATDVPTGGLNSIGLDVETVNKKFGIVQFIEQRNIVGIQNKTVWLSFKARTTGSSISNVKAVVLAWTGTADTVTSDVVSAWNADGVTPTWATNWTAENTPLNLGVTNTWGEYRLSALMDASNIKNVAVFIWCDDTSTTLGDFLYITDVQLEINESPTPFERRPIGLELALCQRYYQRYTATGTDQTIMSGMMYLSGSPIFSLRFPEMRSSPTITFAGVYDIVVPGAVVSGTGVSAINITSTTAQVGCSISATQTAGVAILLRQDSGYYDMSIEL